MNWIIFWIEFSWNNFELNNLFNWISLKQVWIEYWIESILGEIQRLNWINLGIEQGYVIRLKTFSKILELWHIFSSLCWEIELPPKLILYKRDAGRPAENLLKTFFYMWHISIGVKPSFKDWGQTAGCKKNRRRKPPSPPFHTLSFDICNETLTNTNTKRWK